MTKKTYSLLLNVTVEESSATSDGRKKQEYYFTGWKNANFKKTLFDLKDPVVQSKNASMQRLGEVIFKSVQKMATGK